MNVNLQQQIVGRNDGLIRIIITNCSCGKSFLLNPDSLEYPKSWKNLYRLQVLPRFLFYEISFATAR